MPPRYPFSRNKPSSSKNDSNGTPNDRPVVVSASGRATTSPAVGALTADSPSLLRARNASPRNPATGPVFQNEAASYPSPSELVRGKGKKKGKGKIGGWMALDGDSPSSSKTLTPTKNIPIPKYDARGYPTKGSGSDTRLSPESTKSLRFENQMPMMSCSHSQDSLASEISSTGAGVDGETGRFLGRSGDRPASYYASSSAASSEVPTPASLYPPVMNYSLSAPSYNPYDNNGYGYSNGYSNGGGSRTSPLPSLYGDTISIHSNFSETSMTHFKRHDALQDSYGAFSISSKGGKKHLVDMFSLPADPATWSYLGPEPDDDFHDPDIRPNRQTRFVNAFFTARGASNIGCLAFLFLFTVCLFAGYPITYNYLSAKMSTLGAYNLGGINATGQIPSIGLFQLIDKDTPQSAYTHTSIETGEKWELIFSDEFNRPGRSFYNGDDPYWEAVDLHYWQTNNLEWYDPKQVTTKDGSLIITLNNIKTNGMNYTGGMISSWNRFCFTGGYVEASVSLPGKSNVYGLWPAIWTMGNLGRAGYGGSLDGMWPYTYDSCDVGTLKNQTLNGKPALTTTTGDPTKDYSLSYLPGQRLSSCTCTSDTSHPGPKHSNGSFVGRGAPEIDMFEATVNYDTLIGEVSQSGQWAPFNPYYYFLNNSNQYSINDPSVTSINTYLGGVYQQATSGLSVTNQKCYTADTGCYSVYGFEYAPGGSDGYISWVNNAKQAWTVRGTAMAPNSDAGVGQRLVSEEPMYLILNLGLSENFGAVDYTGLASLWPVTMAVDYIRVYQDPNNRNIGCDPPNMPTASYIAKYPEIYSNPNITVMGDIPNFTKPKNRLIDTC